MNTVTFIYPKRAQQNHIFAGVIVIITLCTLVLLFFQIQGNALATCAAMLLVAGTGGYLALVFQKQTLSFTLCPTHIQYHCAKGGWSLAWRNIESIAVPSIELDEWHKPLPWVGIRLRSYEPMLESISFRVASQILIQQRALLLTGYRYHNNKAQKLEDMLFDDKPYIAESGIIYRGLLAMLANRMSYTRELLGFDVFIEDNLLDRSPEEFVGFTRRYLASA